jgi:hypothetical protein
VSTRRWGPRAKYYHIRPNGNGPAPPWDHWIVGSGALLANSGSEHHAEGPFAQPQIEPSCADGRRCRRHTCASHRQRVGAALPGDAPGTHQGSGRLARLRSARDGRDVRSKRVRVQSNVVARPQRHQQRDRSRDYRQARTISLWTDPDRRRRCLENQAAECACTGLSPWRKLAQWTFVRLRALRRALYQCRRAFRCRRLHECERDQRRSVSARRSMPARISLPSTSRM